MSDMGPPRWGCGTMGTSHLAWPLRTTFHPTVKRAEKDVYRTSHHHVNVVANKMCWLKPANTSPQET
jgi:hypothetical protein